MQFIVVKKQEYCEDRVISSRRISKLAHKSIKLCNVCWFVDLCINNEHEICCEINHAAESSYVDDRYRELQVLDLLKLMLYTVAELGHALDLEKAQDHFRKQSYHVKEIINVHSPPNFVLNVEALRIDSYYIGVLQESWYNNYNSKHVEH